MALNWCMLTKDARPVPLPQEKLFLTVPSVSLALQPTIDSSTPDKSVKPTTANGVCYVTSQRFVFVSATATPAATSTGAPDELRTLSVPLSHFQDGRLVQPLLAANYYEALVRPVPGGGMERSHLAKISFKEGSSWPFVQAMDECKARFEEERGQQRQAATGEDLPTYSPAAASTSTLRGSAATRPVPTSSAFFDNAIQAQAQPDAETMSAARVAREAELRERMSAAQTTSDAPPAYDDSTRPG